MLNRIALKMLKFTREVLLHVSVFHNHHQGTTITAVAATGLPLERGDSGAVGRGRSGPARPRPTPRSNGNPEAATAVVVAP